MIYALVENDAVVAVSETRMLSDGMIIKAQEARIGQKFEGGKLQPFTAPDTPEPMTLEDAITIIDEIVSKTGIQLDETISKTKLIARKTQ